MGSRSSAAAKAALVSRNIKRDWAITRRRWRWSLNVTGLPERILRNGTRKKESSRCCVAVFHIMTWSILIDEGGCWCSAGRRRCYHEKAKVKIVIFAFGMVKVSRNNRQQEDTNFLNGLNRWSIWYCVLNLRPLSSGASNFDEPRNRSTSTRLHLVHRRRHQETYEHGTSQRLLVSRHSIF